MTWPLAPEITSSGRVDTNDGRQAIWTVAWVARTLVVNPRELFDANIFYPHRNTLAYLEPNIFVGVLAIPAYWATKNALFAYNVVALLSFVLAQIGAFALVRHLTGSRAGATVAGIGFGFCAYTFSHTAHSQLLMTAGLPFALLAMHRYVERPTTSRAIVLGLIVAAEALSCGYYGVFLGLMLVPGLLYYAFARGLWKQKRYWAGTLGAGLLAVLVVLPFLLPVVELQRSTGFERSVQESLKWSATWRSYLASPAHAHRWILPWLGQWGEVLYPGTLAVVLGSAGLVLMWTRRRPAPDRAHVTYYTVLGVLAFWASLGPGAGLYAWLYSLVPVFSLLHAPSRLGLLVTLVLLVFAGYFVAHVTTGRRAPLIAASLALLSLGDLFVAPLRLTRAQPLPAAYESLAKRPYGPVAEFPFFYRRVDYHRHAEYMFWSTYHWRPLVNGYTDYIPPDFREMTVPLSSFPNPESFKILQRLRVRYVLFHLDLYSHQTAAGVKARIAEYGEYLRPIRTEASVWLFEITGWPPPG
ncbi:MAG: hypothetical protein AB1806_08420 [Acidobacteriota bacterium]